MPLKDDWVSGEQWTADDANDVAEAVNAAYVKPGDGIPKADLVAAVQVSLGKADTAVQAVDAATISDSTPTGRSVLTAANAAAARSAIGVSYGSTSGTVVQGNDSRLTPNAAAITDSTATGRAVLTATDAATARSVLGVAYGTTAGTVVQGNDSRLTGVVRRTVLNPTANVTLGSDSDHMVFANIATATPKITFPTAVGNVNMYTIHNKHATTLALQTTASQTIPSTSLTTGQKVTVVSDGSNWVSPW